MKPSEISENCERVLSRYLPMYLDKDCFDVVCGGVACSSALLDLRWDKIFFTGSPRVGEYVLDTIQESGLVLTPYPDR